MLKRKQTKISLKNSKLNIIKKKILLIQSWANRFPVFAQHADDSEEKHRPWREQIQASSWHGDVLDEKINNHV